MRSLSNSCEWNVPPGLDVGSENADGDCGESVNVGQARHLEIIRFQWLDIQCLRCKFLVLE